MVEEEIRKQIHDYIVEATLSDDEMIKDDTLLFEEGIFDSMGLLLLIEFLREKFEIDINDDELVIENFDSINSIIKFILSKSDHFTVTLN